MSLPEVVTVPPVASKKGTDPLTLEVESIVFTHPCVESTYTKVTDCPSVFKTTGEDATPPIFSVPFAETVKLLVCQVAA